MSPDPDMPYPAFLLALRAAALRRLHALEVGGTDLSILAAMLREQVDG